MDVRDALEEVEWERYEEECILAMSDAVRHYISRTKGSSAEEVYQAAIWTDPRARITSIGFETAGHIVQRGGFIIRGENPEAPAFIEYPGYTLPSEFEFRDYHCIYHPSLLCLCAVNLNAERKYNAVMKRVEQSLIRVRDRVIASRVLEDLPRGGKFWFGVNSVEDWYDHVVEL